MGALTGELSRARASAPSLMSVSACERSPAHVGTPLLSRLERTLRLFAKFRGQSDLVSLHRSSSWVAGVGSGRHALRMLLGPRGRTKDSLSSLRILQGHPWGIIKEKGKRAKTSGVWG